MFSYLLPVTPTFPQAGLEMGEGEPRGRFPKFPTGTHTPSGLDLLALLASKISFPHSNSGLPCFPSTLPPQDEGWGMRWGVGEGVHGARLPPCFSGAPKLANSGAWPSSQSLCQECISSPFAWLKPGHHSGLCIEAASSRKFSEEPSTFRLGKVPFLGAPRSLIMLSHKVFVIDWPPLSNCEPQEG